MDTEVNKKIYKNNTVGGEFNAAESIVNTDTGHVVSITGHDKRIYTYLRTQYSSYKKDDKDYFESNLSIGLHLDICEATIKNSIKKFKDLDLIIIGGTRLYRTITVINLKPAVYKLLHPKLDYYLTEEATNKRAIASEKKAKVIADKRKEHEAVKEAEREVKRKENEESSRKFLNRKANNESISRKRVLISSGNINYKQKEFLENEILTIEMDIASVKFQRTKEKDLEYRNLIGISEVQTPVDFVESSPEIELPPIPDDWFNSYNEDFNSGYYGIDDIGV